MGKRPGETDEMQWYALRVVPQKEYVVARLLERRDAWAYVPTVTYFRRRTRYTESGAEYAKPEMPGCIFARFSGEPAWYDVLRNHLILGPIGRNGEPWQFRARELYMYFTRTPNGTLVIKRGEPAQVSVQGRLLRAPTTQVRTISKRKTNDDPVVEPTRHEAEVLGALAVSPQVMLAAA